MFAVLPLLHGCLGLNAARSLEKGGIPGPGQAVIIYGVRVDSPWSAPQFQVSLDAYNVKEEALDGGCWRLNRTVALVSGKPGPTKYFSFEVPPGDYVYGSWGAPSLRGGAKYFSASADQAVFVGEFVYKQANEVELLRDLEAVRPAIFAALPDTPKDISFASARPVGTIRMFLCTP
ncbi:hypothetical protein [Polaromonas sp.]|uniref:hypothetical protein n=1 Tax=Polaromonas sp. TaxID=1869339 RepID=UPI003267554B